MATQLADRGPHSTFRSAKFGSPHFLEFAVGVREEKFWGGNSFNQIGEQNPIQIAVKTFFFLDWTQRIFIFCIWIFAKTSWIPLLYSMYDCTYVYLVYQSSVA